MRNATAKQRREWQAWVTAMPTRADIKRCQDLWPTDWEEKNAFTAGQVASLLAEVEQLRECAQVDLDLINDYSQTIALMREIVAAVARLSPWYRLKDGTGARCHFCMTYWPDGDFPEVHDVQCAYERARELLADNVDGVAS